MSATNFRKNLFQTLDRALQGEAVEIAYKGSRIHLSPAGGSKLSRAVRRPTLLVHADALVDAGMEAGADSDKRWLEDYRNL